MRGWLAEAAVALATAVTIACGTGTSRQTKGADQFVLRVGLSADLVDIRRRWISGDGEECGAQQRAHA
jgi:hypothetical protein